MNLPEFSGRTTCLEHKRNWEQHPKNLGKECIRNVKLFDVQWSNCPVEIEKEVIQMWRDWELGNDNYIIKWNWEMASDYPLIAAFLESKGLTEDYEIIIHWWW